MNLIINKIANGVVFFGSMLVALLVVEFMLPVAKLLPVEFHVYQYYVPIIQYIYGRFHPVLDFTLQPNLQEVHLSYPPYLDYTVSTNSEGFRGAEIDRKPGRRNIVVLGDSFAMGWGVAWPQTFSQIMAAKLQGRDPSYQVVNLGQSGYDLDQVVNCFDLYGKALRPDYTIYLICYNDTEGELPGMQTNGSFDWSSLPAKRGGEVEFVAKARRNNVLIWNSERFVKGSRLSGFYEYYLRPLFDAQRKTWQKKLDYKDMSPPNEPGGRVALDDEKKRYLWDGLEKLYTLNEGRPLLLMHTSHKYALHMEDSAGSYRWILRDFANLHPNTYFVDFESRIRALNDGVARFFPIDEHWNAQGHRLAGEMLIEAIDARR